MVSSTENLADKRQRILNLMKIRGPCLPIHISKEVNTSLLLAGAFLSQLASDKTIKISYLKVGGSPLYFLPGQEAMLENFTGFIKGKEKEAYTLIKENRVLEDSSLDPAIRVAIRGLKDFVIPIKVDSKDSLFWRYYTTSEEEAKPMIQNLIEKPIAEKRVEPVQILEIKPIPIIEAPVQEMQIQPPLSLLQVTPELEIKQEAEMKPEIAKRREKIPPFLEQIKSMLLGKNIELVSIEKSGKKEALLRIKENGKESLLYALDKKKVDESDVLKAYKKATLLNLPYTIFSKGETSKKLNEKIEAYKKLDKIDKF
jgi:hypothetical protein